MLDSRRPLIHALVPGILNKFQLCDDIAIDLGTSSVQVYCRGKGLIFHEPSIIAVDTRTQQVIAFGHKAKEMYGKTSRSIKCVRPLRGGVVADFAMASLMVRTMLRSVLNQWRLLRPRAVMAVPCDATQVERRALVEAALSAGIRKIMLVEETTAAAVGAGQPVLEARGSMVLDIGGGTTEVAIMSLGGRMYAQSIRVAGDQMDEAIQKALRQTAGIEVALVEAERIKVAIGAALPFITPLKITTFGRDIATGLPKQFEVSSHLVHQALEEPVQAIIRLVKTALEFASPEIADDLMNRGIFLVGGGSLLQGLPERIALETAFACERGDDPLTSVVRGVGKVVENRFRYQVSAP